MPQGDQRGSGWQFYDATYDGIWDGSLLSQGLGQLTDGKLGPDNFKAYYDQDRGSKKKNHTNPQIPMLVTPILIIWSCSDRIQLQKKNILFEWIKVNNLGTCSLTGWVGWRNDSHNGQPIEIVFEFDSVRDFTSLSIFANNQFTRDIQVHPPWSMINNPIYLIKKKR